MSMQAAAAHEAALGGGHVTTWIAVRGYVVDEQIIATLKTPLQQSNTQTQDTYASDHTMHQQVCTVCDASIQLMTVQVVTCLFTWVSKLGSHLGEMLCM